AAQVLSRRDGAPDVHLSLVLKEGREEAQALNMVDVEVGEEDVDAAISMGEQVAKVTDTTAGVEDALGRGTFHEDTRGVTAVSHRFGPRRRQRPARPEERHQHDAEGKVREADCDGQSSAWRFSLAEDCPLHPALSTSLLFQLPEDRERPELAPGLSL